MIHKVLFTADKEELELKHKSLIIQASNRCPCCCPGCYNHFADAEDISTEQIVRFAVGYIHRFETKKVTISGGDPLMRKDIIRLLDDLMSLGIDISVDTVGLSIVHDRILTDVLKRASVVGLPLDGMTDKTLNTFRPGLQILKLLQVIRIASENGLRICINTVVHAQNAHEISLIAQFVNKTEGVKKWQLFQYMPIGPRGSENAAQYMISNQEFQTVCEQIYQLPFRADVSIECKSMSCRRNRYLLLGADGTVWHPKQTFGDTWETKNEQNSQRVVIGHINDERILDKIAEVIEI